MRAKAVTNHDRATREQSLPHSGLVALTVDDAVKMPFSPGDVIGGKYEVERLLGSGGMGYVVAATHVELGEAVALKFLRPEALAYEELVERFAREARAAASIKSEHIARVYDVGALPDGVPFIVMEHLEGKDLADTLHAGGPLPIKVAVDYVMQTCEALAAAHASGIVHRDIKPENLFLTRQAQGMDVIKVLDFGISKVALTGSTRVSKRAFVRTMMPLGSPVYMSPEQIRSCEQVDARTDIWSLGCVLFELLTGVTAFNEPSLLQLSAAILEQDPVPLRAVLPDAPEELELVIARCLQKDANLRFQNVAELAIALYPFAPRRARISVERCYHALRNAGAELPELELNSVYPPSLASLPNLKQTQSPLVTAPAELRTSAPATVSVPEAPPDFRAGGGSRRFVWIALGLAAAAGVAFALREQPWRPAPVAPAAAAAAPRPGADARPASETSAPAPASAANVLDLDNVATAATPSASNGAAKSERSAKAKYRAPVKRAGAPHRADDDLDPGF